MALIDPKDAENIYNSSGWAARRKEAREWRDVLFGIPPSTDVSPVSIVLTSDDDQHKALCAEYEQVIAGVLYQSKAASLFRQAGLMMQVLGGWAFRVTSEPHTRHLKYRTRLVRPTAAFNCVAERSVATSPTRCC